MFTYPLKFVGTMIVALKGHTVVTKIETMETNVPKPGKVISRLSHQRVVRHFALLPGSHIAQDKEVGRGDRGGVVGVSRIWRQRMGQAWRTWSRFGSG